MSKILIADDSDIMRRIAKDALVKAGFEVIEASNGVEAVSLAKTEMPQLILLDAEMPEMDGWEACKVIKTDVQTQKVPVLMCTGHDLSDEADMLTDAGANGYITKPYNILQMLDKINGQI